MKPNEQLKEYLINYGWKFNGACHCGGMQTYKFNLITKIGEYKIRLRSSHLLISKPNERFVKFSIIELKAIVNEIYQNNKTSVQAQDKI